MDERIDQWISYIVDTLRKEMENPKIVYEWFDNVTESSWNRIRFYMDELSLMMTKDMTKRSFSSIGISVSKEERRNHILAYVLHSWKLLKTYQESQIPIEDFESAIKELGRKMETARKLGTEIDDINFQWLDRIFGFNIIQIGRLQFGYGQIKEPLYVIKNKRSGDVQVFMREQYFDQDGYIQIEKNTGNKSYYDDTSKYYIGNMISKEGKFTRKRIKLAKNEWEMKACQGQRTIEVHIPADGRLDAWKCEKSFERFEQLHLNMKRGCTSFVCRSWLMGGSLKMCLEEDSNIALFQKMFTLYPYPRNEQEIWKRVFGQQQKPEDEYIANSSLQKNILNAYKEGKRVFGGGGVRLLSTNKINF